MFEMEFNEVGKEREIVNTSGSRMLKWRILFFSHQAINFRHTETAWMVLWAYQTMFHIEMYWESLW